MWWESDVMKHLRWKNQLLVAYVFKNKSLNWRNPVDSSNFDHCNIFFPKVNCDCSSCICEGGSCQSQFVSTCKFLIAHVNDLSTNGYFIPVTGRIQNLCNWKDWLCSHCVLGLLEGILGLVGNRNLCYVIDDKFLAITCVRESLNFHRSVRLLTVA